MNIIRGCIHNHGWRTFCVDCAYRVCGLCYLIATHAKGGKYICLVCTANRRTETEQGP